jgi:hypothetical protein
MFLVWDGGGGGPCGKEFLCATRRFLGSSLEESGAGGGVEPIFVYEEEEEDGYLFAFSLPLDFLGGSGWMSLETSSL